MSLSTAAFSATRWTLVRRSCGEDTEARAALSDLCAAYYTPVVAFLRRDGRAEDAARELAHAFFARILKGGAFDGAEPAKGRFRNYLLGALKHFAADQRDRAQTAKRGGGQEPVPWQTQDGETDAGLQIADDHAESPDKAFDRQWALTVLANALEGLSADMMAEGKQRQLEILKPWLTGDSEDVRQADAAVALGVSEATLKVAVHRLRRRFRTAVKAEISQTVDDPGRVDEELEHLRATLGGR